MTSVLATSCRAQDFPSGSRHPDEEVDVWHNPKRLYQQPPFPPDSPYYPPRPPGAAGGGGYDEDEDGYVPQYPKKFTSDLFGDSPASDTAKCFSCMSKFYEAVWPALAHVYKPPVNFTDRCNEAEIDPKAVAIVHCPTVCVSMWEEAIVGGVRIRGHIRGCMDDLLHNGFNQTIVAKYRWMNRDSCKDYRKRELFKLPPAQSDDSSIHVCICYADHCNASSSAQQASARIFSLTLSMTVFLSILSAYISGMVR